MKETKNVKDRNEESSQTDMPKICKVLSSYHKIMLYSVVILLVNNNNNNKITHNIRAYHKYNHTKAMMNVCIPIYYEL